MDPDLLLADEPLDAAVAALARRNAHHFQDMTPEEQQSAIGHWRELALDVLAAARSVLASEPGATDGVQPTAQGGRAVLVFEDAGGEDVAVHASFHPELEEVGPQEIAGTPAQLTALTLLQELAPEDE